MDNRTAYTHRYIQTHLHTGTRIYTQVHTSTHTKLRIHTHPYPPTQTHRFSPGVSVIRAEDKRDSYLTHPRWHWTEKKPSLSLGGGEGRNSAISLQFHLLSLHRKTQMFSISVTPERHTGPVSPGRERDRIRIY